MLTPTFSATAVDAGANPGYQWKKNGMPAGTNSATFSAPLLVGDEVVCELTTRGCSNNVTVVSNRFRFEAINQIEPEVTTVATSTTICSGTEVTFTATNKSGNTNPVYLWSVNGTPVAGSNNPVFTTKTLTDGASVECMMSVPQCNFSHGSTKDKSDPIVIKITPALQPTIAVATPTLQVCKGAPVPFSATVAGAGNNPVLTWQINGATVQTGSTNFVTTALQHGDKVSCTVTVNPAESCGTPAPVTSQVLEMEVKEFVLPTIAISTGNTAVCAGDTVVFQAAVTNPGTDPELYWEVNGQKAAGNVPRFASAGLKNGDKVRCVISTLVGCGAAVIASNEIQMQVRATPAISTASDTITIWAGEQAQLQAAITGDVDFYRWTPAASLEISASLEPFTKPLESDVTFRLTAVSPDNCMASADVLVKVKHRLLLPNAFTPNGDGINDVFRIPSGVPIELKNFLVFDRWGNAVFSTNKTGTGWDGHFRGKPLPAGVYVYLIEGKYEGQMVRLKGNVVLAK